jgi:hypothetical protein
MFVANDETVALLRRVLENDLREYAHVVAKETGVDVGRVLACIPPILQANVEDKMREAFYDPTRLKYRCELRRFSVGDLREVCKRCGVRGVGTRAEIEARLCETLKLRDGREYRSYGTTSNNAS